MVNQDPISPDLQETSQLFHNWRADNGKKHYPEKLWEAAYQLAAKYPLRRVARTLNVNPHHLRTKMRSALCKGNKDPQFVEVLPPIEQQPKKSLVELRISQGVSLEMAIKFDGSVCEVMPLIESLFCGRKFT